MKRARFLIGTAAMMSLALGSVAQHGKSGMSGGGHTMSRPTRMHASSGKSKTQTTHGQRTIEQKLTSNAKLAGKIHDLTAMDAQAACAGFKNLGQCVAAAHVSQNLGLTFAELKNTMLALNADGTPNTTAEKMSLGKAIQTLKPEVDSTAEVKKANRQVMSDTSSGS